MRYCLEQDVQHRSTDGGIPYCNTSDVPQTDASPAITQKIPILFSFVHSDPICSTIKPCLGLENVRLITVILGAFQQVSDTLRDNRR